MDPRIKAQADALIEQDALARAKGKTPEQIEARRAVVDIFCRMHLPDAPPTLRDGVDYEQPVAGVNGRTASLENPKGGGLFGLGAKPSYLVSKTVPPKSDEDPIYALQYFPRKNQTTA